MSSILIHLPLLLDPRVTLRNQSSFSLLRKFHVADRFNARYGRDIGRSFFLSSDRCVAETSDAPCSGEEEQGMSSQVELFFARSRASAQAPRRFFLEREPNRSLNDPCRTSRCTHRRGGERGGSISLDPNNNRSWNGLHLDSLAETANNRKNGAILNYRGKYLFQDYVVIPLLLEIYFLGWINDSIRIRSDVKFYSSKSIEFFDVGESCCLLFLARRNNLKN